MYGLFFDSKLYGFVEESSMNMRPWVLFQYHLVQRIFKLK